MVTDLSQRTLLAVQQEAPAQKPCRKLLLQVTDDEIRKSVLSCVMMLPSMLQQFSRCK